MELTELVKHGHKAARLCKQWGYAQDSEDASQYVIEHRLRGRKGPVKNILIDYLRRTYGDSRALKHRARQESTRRTIGEDGFDVADSRIVTPGAGLDCEYLLKDLNSVDRAVFILSNMWGFSETEIAYLFGVTTSRIYQRLKGVAGSLSENPKEESDSSIKETGIVSKMEQVKRPKVSCQPFKSLAGEEPGEMEGFDASCFEEWLT